MGKEQLRAKSILNRTTRRKVVLWFVVFLLLIGVGLFVGFNRTTGKQFGVLSKYQKVTTFPLYYPTRLPDGYKIDENTVSTSERVVLYQIKHTSGEIINVSMQPKPTDFDFEEFYHGTLKSPQSAIISIGKITFGQINRGSLASIETSETWILINSTSPLEFDQLRPLANSLQKID